MTFSAGYKLRSDDYIDANIKLALSAATEVQCFSLPDTLSCELGLLINTLVADLCLLPPEQYL